MLIENLSRATGTRPIAQCLDAISDKTAAPLADRLLRNPHSFRNNPTVDPFRAFEHDPCALREALTRLPTPDVASEHLSLLIEQGQFRLWSPPSSHRRLRIIIHAQIDEQGQSLFN